MIKIKYFYLNKLTYYGTFKLNDIIKLSELGQKLSEIEINIVGKSYNYYVNKVNNNINDENIYYLIKILLTYKNIINEIMSLF